MRYSLRLLTLQLTLISSAMVLALGLASCRGRPRATIPLTISSVHHEADTLTYIAYDRGLFAANGLDVTIKDYSAGTTAVDGLLKGEVDLATASEFVIVQNAFKRQPIRSIGTIGKNYNESLIGRTDRGIRDIQDLRGKKIGIPQQTAVQFYFGRFLELHGLNQSQMTVVNINIAQSADLLINGDVDAVQTWEPYVSAIKDKLGDGVVVWPAQSEQSLYWNVIGAESWVTQHPDVVDRVLNSFAQAESYLLLHQDEAKAIVQKRLQYDARYMTLVWPMNQFTLSLDQSLVVAMEDEARWMIRSNLTPEKTTPNFSEYVYVDGLERVKPDAVNIIH